MCIQGILATIDSRDMLLLSFTPPSNCSANVTCSFDAGWPVTSGLGARIQSTRVIGECLGVQVEGVGLRLMAGQLDFLT